MATLSDLTNRELGQYRLMELLGEGGMGTVYRATQGRLRRDVAVKILPSSLSSNEGLQERFMREAQTAANLEHSNIVTIYDFGMQDKLSYVVMQFLKGGALEERIEAQKAGKLDFPSLHEISDFLTKVSAALDYAHSRGVVHRDIKPGNIMFNDKGSPYIVDFGIAKLMNATTHLTGTGIAVGTPVYMSPEQWRGLDITPAADQYALGGLMYHLLTGRPPFDAPNQFALMNKHLTEMPLPPDAVNPNIPAGISDVLARSLAKEPADRFPRLKDFARAFERVAISFPGEKTDFFTAPLPDMTEIMAAKKPALDDPMNTNPAKKLDSVTGHEWISNSESQDVRMRRRNYQNWALTGVITVLLLLVGVIIFLGLSSETTESGTEEAIVDEVDEQVQELDQEVQELLNNENLPTHELTVVNNSMWSSNITYQAGIDMAQVPPGCFLASRDFLELQALVDQCETTGGSCNVNLLKQGIWTCIEEPFYIDKYEVSNAHFELFNGLSAVPSAWSEPEQPRTNVTRDEAQVFCALRGARLATEIEWEYAARGPDELLYPWGNVFSRDYVVEEANTEACNVRCRSNGKSWVGAMNLSGNVAEWLAPSAETPENLIVRGGAWGDAAVWKYLTQSALSEVQLDVESDLSNVGFRCVTDDSDAAPQAPEEVVADIEDDEEEEGDDTLEANADATGFDTGADIDDLDVVDDGTIIDDSEGNEPVGSTTDANVPGSGTDNVLPEKPVKEPKALSAPRTPTPTDTNTTPPSGNTGGSSSSSNNVPSATDRDGDGVPDSEDNCPDYANDNVGDPCNVDEDNDGVWDNIDSCPFEPADEPNGCVSVDSDGDGIPDYLDACYLDPNNDSYNDPCSHDEDGDGVLDDNDACPASPNDPYNDPCNHDEDGDGILDVSDGCPGYYNDTFGDPCNPDEDGDGDPDASDVCPFDPMHDPIGNPCNHNEDGDLCPDISDPFPFNPTLPLACAVP